MKKIVCWLPLVFLGLCFPASALEEEGLLELEKVLARFQAEAGFPGAGVGYLLPSGREGTLSVGLADREEEIPLKPADRFLSGSIGKTYVAAVALQLVAEGRLALDSPIHGWLGEESWFERLPNARQITPRMLLNHTSGIPEHVYFPEFGQAVADDPDRVWKPAEIVAYVLDKEPLFAAGEGWSYADTNYIVLGMVMEKASGKTVYGEIQRRLLQPLGLNDTLPSDQRLLPGLIPGYAGLKSPFKKQGKTLREGRLVINPQVEWTGGGLACTPLDLARWARALFQGKVIPEDLKETHLDGVPAWTGKGDRYSLGVQIWNSAHGTCYGHGGWFPGYLSLMAYYPEHNLALAIQLNTDRIPKGTQALRDTLDRLAGLLLQAESPEEQVDRLDPEVIEEGVKEGHHEEGGHR